VGAECAPHPERGRELRSPLPLLATGVLSP
jgi:hypothetical protein